MTAIHHIRLSVSDLETATRFYSPLLEPAPNAQGEWKAPVNSSAVPNASHPAHSHRGFYLATVNWSAIH